MRELPPDSLVDLVGRLGLADAAQVASVSRRAQRLARGLPLFTSVWVDALVQVRLLTPFQAAEINAGRGSLLRLGPYVLCRELASLGYARCYAARTGPDGQPARLTVIQHSADRVDEALERLERLVEASGELVPRVLAPVEAVGVDQGRLWAASRGLAGQTAAEWLIRHGRFPPEAVLEIARVMIGALASLERSDVAHGDIRAETLLVDVARGGVVLMYPGLRAAVRPFEGYGAADLPPEAFDGLAPERIGEPLPASMLGDYYSCGCLWWRLLTGRSPLPGGNAMVKLRAAERAEIADVRQLAPDTPEPLAAAIASCLAREPDHRCSSVDHLAALLGPSSPGGVSKLRRWLAEGGDRAARGVIPAPVVSRPHVARHLRWWLGAVAAVAIGATAVFWAVSRGGMPGSTSPALPEPPRPTVSPPLAEHVSDARADAEKTTAVTSVAEPEIEPEPRAAVVDAPEPVVVSSQQLVAGARVGGSRDKPRTLLIPRDGLLVNVPDLRFEHCVFVWHHEVDPAARRPAMIRVEASGMEFQGCAFWADDAGPVGVRWVHPADRDAARRMLPSGAVKLTDCVFRGVTTAIDCQTVGAVAIRVGNTLHEGSGALVCLDHAPAADESVLVELDRVTLRDSGPVLECVYGDDGPLGKIAIRASGCAFLPRSDTALLWFVGKQSPRTVLGHITWEGEGSLVGPETAIAGWLQPDATREVLDDAAVSIDGLARSRVEFAGPAGSDPAGSRITQWQAPLRSTDPPGADPERLPKGVADANQRQKAP